ncbi:MAG: hypothetical protein ACOC2U_00870 [bacterium]
MYFFRKGKELLKINDYVKDQDDNKGWIVEIISEHEIYVESENHFGCYCINKNCTNYDLLIKIK